MNEKNFNEKLALVSSDDFIKVFGNLNAKFWFSLLQDLFVIKLQISNNNFVIQLVKENEVVKESPLKVGTKNSKAIFALLNECLGEEDAFNCIAKYNWKALLHLMPIPALIERKCWKELYLRKEYKVLADNGELTYLRKAKNLKADRCLIAAGYAEEILAKQNWEAFLTFKDGPEHLANAGAYDFLHERKYDFSFCDANEILLLLLKYGQEELLFDKGETSFLIENERIAILIERNDLSSDFMYAYPDKYNWEAARQHYINKYLDKTHDDYVIYNPNYLMGLYKKACDLRQQEFLSKHAEEVKSFGLRQLLK